MPDEVRLALAFAVSLALTFTAVPLAIGVAARTSFYDVPVGYKGHRVPTPYLGGAALMAGFVPAAIVFCDGLGEFAAVLAGAFALFIVGTIDDRMTVHPVARMAVSAAAGALLFSAGLGFDTPGGGGADLAVTTVFVLGVVNAYNLIDNIDGAAATVGAVSVAGLGLLCAAEGHVALGALFLAMAGACVGFLPRNLSRPARIFLGDGGSMPIGLVAAAAVMCLPATDSLGWAIVPVAAVLVAVPALDTALVIVSRLRRGARVYHGARDHLTHRLLTRLGSPRRVAAVLAIAQGALVAGGIALSELAPETAFLGSTAILIAGAGLIAALERPSRQLAPAQTSAV